MRKIFYQNDFSGLPGVYDGGCLYMSLLDIVSKEFNHKFNRKEIKAIYVECNNFGALGTSKDKKADGAYVWDHTAVLNIASNVIGNRSTWMYTARIYTSLMEDKGYTSFVSDSNYTIDDDTYMILQVRTTAVPGHFKSFNYDPWKTGSREVCLKSTRYYKRIS